MSKLPLAAKELLHAFTQCAAGSIEINLPGGTRFTHRGTQPGPHAEAMIYNWDLVPRIAARGNIGVGETFVEKMWDTPDLVNFIEFALRNEQALLHYAYEKPLQRAVFYFLNTILRRNNRTGSRNNIRAHYDVGNEFYRLWLDGGMTYSSALRENSNDNLMTAQDRKYARILDRIRDTGARVLEIGCGWGGFAEAALSRAHKVLGITLSQPQHDFAAQRLGQHAHIALEDYRNVTGKFDHLVSIEMFEAVGQRYWPHFFDTVKNRLASGGKAIVQTITIAEDTFEHYRRHSDYIRQYIFPGGMLPSKERFTAAAQKAGLTVRDAFAFGQDYAWTLRQWQANFGQKWDQIRQLGYSENFMRSWIFYFGMCIGGFQMGRTDVVQFELQHA